MTNMFATIPATVDIEEFMPKVGYPADGSVLNYLQAEVGGYVEAVDVVHPHTGERATMWINDEGRINGLPRNPAAEVIADVCGQPGLAEAGLHGPAVFTGYDPETGETLPLSDDWRYLLGDATTGFLAALFTVTFGLDADVIRDVVYGVCGG